MEKLPLEGIRIADCTQAWAGPHCTQLLADLGAEVIKVEPPYGEISRGGKNPISGTYPNNEYGERPWNRNCVFNPKNRNKKSISIDLTREEGRDLFKRLVKISDVVTDNYAAGVMDRMGTGYKELCKVKPDIIVSSSNGYGPSGPWSRFHSYGVIQEPMCGFMALTGYIDDETPYRSGVDHIDPLTGIHMAGAIIAALIYRKKTGKGQQINVSMLESGVNFLGPALLNYVFNGRMLEHKGNRHGQDAMAPHGCYRSKGDDDWLTIAVGSDEEWQGLCKAMDNPTWASDRRFSDRYGRVTNQDELDKLVEAWTLEKDKYEAMHILQTNGVAAGPVLGMDEIFNEPHFKARGFWQKVEHPDVGTLTQIGPRYRFMGEPVRPARHAPLFAEHTEYVFRGLLGLSKAELDKAIADSIVSLVPAEARKGARAG